MLEIAPKSIPTQIATAPIMGFRKLSARPRHHAQDVEATADFKNVWPAPSASDFIENAIISLLQRIRPRAFSPAKMEIRASRSA